ncbi:hypothetical protein AVEN_176006-1 [Araneus ventricosus]|uniref:Uncharacterized protein n=1 Tax=Araneus ventricosus TaxID=182803 RepID=A0A4Y2EN96_ARAVE|nr:hypothetical protein AVEN_176006-1 [Araneus ventricosus]
MRWKQHRLQKGRTSLKDMLHFKDCSREVGEHVVFGYEGEFFSGKFSSITESGVNIISMLRTLKSWKWPNKSDMMEYLWKDVVEYIVNPKIVCKRGFYAVPQLQNIG